MSSSAPTRVPGWNRVRLALVMLRYRAALMVWLFMLLGVAQHGGLGRLGTDHVAALVALAASYIAATSINDIADQELDRVNHPGDAARPLVTGSATERDLWIVYAGATGVAMAAAAVVGLPALAIAVVGLLIGFIYSVPPLAVSYRTYASPLLLMVAYVAVPYSLGVAASGAVPDQDDLLPLAAYGALFVARIVLKDFRDSAGDSMYGRRTLLQRYGRTAVCRISLLSVVLGDALLLAALRPPLGVTVALQGFVAGIVWMLWQVEAASGLHREQVAIGIGARLGNGLLLTVLGVLALRGADASPTEIVLFAWSLTVVFVVNVGALAARPDEVLVGYKG
ncbi:MAG TPA: UbiA family prenyltransferase [Actinomycetota bacterium]|nr:UbiA family prenyltransferase [Actinomycetota bacterium]